MALIVLDGQRRHADSSLPLLTALKRTRKNRFCGTRPVVAIAQMCQPLGLENRVDQFAELHLLAHRYLIDRRLAGVEQPLSSPTARNESIAEKRMNPIVRRTPDLCQPAQFARGTRRAI